MNLGLANVRVLVTGSSRGIGLGVAEVFLEEGACVAISGRTAAGVEQSAASLRERFGVAKIAAVTGDFSGDEAGIDRAVTSARDALGGLDVVVANVGSGRGAIGLDADAAEWSRMLQLNLVGAASVARLAAPHLAGGSSIVFISSIAGVEALGAPLPYSAAKAGLLALVANLSRQLAARGIRVNAVSPGNVIHPGGSWEARRQRDPEGADAYVRAEVPMARFGTPRDIGSAVAFLASPTAAAFITGANLIVDGGQTRAF